MNERIKELAEQAGIKEELVVMFKGDKRAYVLSKDDVEKFAELIVRECFDVVINDGRFHDARGIIRAGKYTAMEHFGVQNESTGRMG